MVDPLHASTSANPIDHLSSYELAHLISHFAQAGWHGDLYRLLHSEFCESRVGGRQVEHMLLEVLNAIAVDTIASPPPRGHPGEDLPRAPR